MDTKWKKSRRIRGLIGVVLQLAAIGMTAALAMSNPWARYGSEYLERGIPKENYQELQSFRNLISQYLDLFLAMAADGVVEPVGLRYGYGGYCNFYGDASDLAEDPAVLEETVVFDGRAVESAYGSWYSDSGTAWEAGVTEAEGYEESAPTKEENRKAAERAHAYYAPDKNILYTVKYDGKMKFDNTDGFVLDGLNGAMPEGYHFLLFFDGEKVRIWQDGEQIDPYGDGFYRDDSLWYVPGYENYPVREDGAKTEICIAAFGEPYPIVGENGAYDRTPLYLLAQDLEEVQQYFAAWVTAAGVWLALLILLLLMPVREGWQYLGSVLGKVWFEVKAAVFLGMFLGGGVLLLIVFADYLWYDDLTGSVMIAALLTDWYLVLRLLLSDRKANGRLTKKSLFGRLRQTLRIPSFSQHLGERIVKQSRNVFVTELAATVICCMTGLYLVFGWMGVWYGNWENLVYVPMFLSAGGVGVSLWMTFRHLKKSRSLAEDLDALTAGIRHLQEGNGRYEGLIPSDPELEACMKILDHVGEGLEEAVTKRIQSERMKVELITNVSHDIKTPLTSIISYAELLKQEEGLPEHVGDYIRILSEKAERLRTMVQDVFEVSKAASGQLNLRMEPLDLAKLMRQTLADMDEEIARSGMDLRIQIPEEEIGILADGQRMYRVFQNLIQNALKYSLEGSRIYISLERKGTMAIAGVRNTSKEEIRPDADLTERFVRGDASRSDGGSGLGLSIARSFTEGCCGVFQVEVVADLFMVTVSFEMVSLEGS